ncbi:hypothetical protein Hanom_Chr15g01376311 [Helianthus anomalus]
MSPLLTRRINHISAPFCFPPPTFPQIFSVPSRFLSNFRRISSFLLQIGC